MKRFLVALPPQAEFAIVLLGAFGIPTIYGLLIATRVFDQVAISDARLVRLLVIELATLALLGAFLRARGWTLQRLGLSTPTIDDVINAFGLLAAAYLIPATILLFVPDEIGHSIEGGAFAHAPAGLSLALVVLASAVNPIFEEVFVVGYIFAASRSGSLAVAINVSVALRLLYHLYQGPSSVIFILPLGIVFAWWYSTSPRLWPLILAHAALDLIGLFQHVGG